MSGFAIKSYGCQMNAYDADRMAEALRAAGHADAASADDADLVVLNTCHIRERAAEKTYSEIGRILKAARVAGRARPRIAVAGCTAQAEGAEIVARAKAVDVVVGPQAYHRLPALLERAQAGPVVDTDMPAETKFGHLPARARRAPPSAFLTVQEGCDKFCTFCVVPYTRGAQVSRPAGAVLDEARTLVDAGARELTLLGQNVNAWESDGRGFDWLVRAVAALPGVKRLRYTTSHPRDMTQALMDCHRDVPELMPYLHLPVQAGSDELLKAMNRRHKADEYVRLIERVRAARPDIAISGDFIVGFPGETDADFDDTLRLVETVGYAQAFSFKYSPRLGTPAAEREDQVPEPVKEARLAALQGALGRSQRAFNEASVGRSCQVLLERRGKLPGQFIGKSPWLQSVHVTGAFGIGDLVEVELASATASSLEGRPVAALDAAA